MNNLAELWKALRARKIVQWGLAYLGAAWFLIELSGELADTWGWPAVALQTLQVALLLGLPMALVIAWHHGEKGRQRVSGSELVTIGLLLALAGVAVSAVWARRDRTQDTDSRAAASLGSEVRIAVLPLEAGPSEDDAWLASGLRSELIHEFASIPSLLVVGRSGVGNELAVDYLVEGQVRRSDSAVRLSLRLLSAADQSVVETVAEDRALDPDSLSSFQVEAARRVAAVLGGQLRAVQSALESGRAPDPEAFRLFLQARGGVNPLSELQRRDRLLRRALELDPEFLAAAAELARVANWMAWNFSSEVPDAPERATEAVRRLRMLGGSDVESLRAEAEFAYRVERDGERALERLEELIQKDPGDAEALLLGGAILRRMGRWDDAVAWMVQGFDVDPYGGIAWNLGETHQMLRNWPEAEQYYNRAVGINPHNPFAQSTAAFLPIYSAGDTAASRRYLEALPESLRGEIEGPWYRYTARFEDEALRLRLSPPVGTGSSIGRARRIARLGLLARLSEDEAGARAWADSLITFIGTVEWSSRPEARANLRSLEALAHALHREDEAAGRAIQEAIELNPPSRDPYVAGLSNSAVGINPTILLLTGDLPGAAKALADLLTRPSLYSPWSVRLDPMWAEVARLEPLASLLPKG